MKKTTGKSILGLVLLKSAIIAGWYVYGKYLAKGAEVSSKSPVNKPNEQTAEVKKEANLNTTKPVVKSTPAKKVAIKKPAAKVVKKKLVTAVVKEEIKKVPIKRKTKAA